MFKNKKKLDSKIRFQNQAFKNRLNQARGYKRPHRSVPKTDWEILLNKIGLGSWLARFFCLLALGFLVYLVYIPNFLFIKHINIKGADESLRANIEKSAGSFLEKKLPWPQKNLALLSKSKLADYLLKNNSRIKRVNSVGKKFPDTLTVDITPRVDGFTIETQAGTYILSNDGIITGRVVPGASGTLPSALSLIKLNQTEILSVGEQALSEEKVNFIARLQSRLPAITKSDIGYFQIEDPQTPDLTVYLKNGFKTFFDFTSDADKTLTQLTTLLSQFSDADLKKLFYVDMRFEDKGYLCYKGEACVKDINFNSATSTPNSLTN